MELMRADKKAKDRMERLRAIRVCLHGIASQRQFAAVLGVSYKRYQNWEGSGYPVSSAGAKMIKDITPGMTVDYILYDDESGLTAEVLRRLRSGCRNR